MKKAKSGLIKLDRNAPHVVLYKICLNASSALHEMTVKALLKFLK